MNAHLKLTKAGANLIQHFEGCLQKKGDLYHAYKCPAGVWTCGWGSTHHGGWDIGSTTRWTAAECNEAFLSDMAVFEKSVRRLVKVPLEQYQFDSLVSFTYNVGEGNLAKSTLLKKVNAKDFAGAAKEFSKWNKANGKVLAGLTRRRASEALLFQNILDANYDGKADPKPPEHPMPQMVDNPED
jgi:GH24 family phage-related lysozyme (muramidase)